VRRVVGFSPKRNFFVGSQTLLLVYRPLHGRFARQSLWNFINEQGLDITEAAAHWHETEHDGKPAIEYSHDECKWLVHFSVEEWDMLGCCRLHPSPSTRKVKRVLFPKFILSNGTTVS
jgi:hypothetical protein